MCNKTHEPVIRCNNCGTVIHSGEMCESCEKQFYIDEVINSLFIYDEELDRKFSDAEYDAFIEQRDEMRSLGMGR